MIVFFKYEFKQMIFSELSFSGLIYPGQFFIPSNLHVRLDSLWLQRL